MDLCTRLTLVIRYAVWLGGAMLASLVRVFGHVLLCDAEVKPL